MCRSGVRKNVRWRRRDLLLSELQRMNDERLLR